MEKTEISRYRKIKLIRQNGVRRKATFAEIVYKTPVGKEKYGKMRYVSVTRHELQGFVD